MSGARRGRPVPFDEPVYVTRPLLPPLSSMMSRLEEVWATKQLTNIGAQHDRLETALREYLGVRELSLFTNGTVALITAIRALGDDARNAPPILVARAGLDHPWLNGGADRFVAAATARGATLDLLNHPDGRHGFDTLDDDARSKEVIRHTLAFLKDHLAP